MKRRAFTLLEMVLATALGAMVIVVALALLRSMEKLERPLAVRQQELADLHRARTVMQRAFSSLVMSDTTPPVNVNARRNTNASTTSTDDAAKSAFDATAEATANKQQQQNRPPARLLLESDSSDQLKSMLQQVGVPVDSAGAIQRMELVIDTPPIAPAFRAELGDLIASTYAQNKSGTSAAGSSASRNSSAPTGSYPSTSAPVSGNTQSASRASLAGSNNAASLRSRMTNAVQSGAATGNRTALALKGQSAGKSGALRGSFDIRPMLTQANLDARAEGRPILYELWWTPLAAANENTQNKTAASTEPSTQTLQDPRTLEPWGEPVLLASNLVKCHWQFFSSGEKRSAHSAVWERELPAYVEFEIQTKTGLYENWMFEVGWTKGPELVTTTDLAGGAGGAAGVGDATGAGPAGTGTNGNAQGQGGPGAGPPIRPGGPRGPRNGNPPPPPPPGTGPRYDTIPGSQPK
ncbi:MAG: hypothetical protein JSS51_13400 [Planctomycetes bacterium]|nr:hypothetical protein [Planctomycetota bacterium]